MQKEYEQIFKIVNKEKLDSGDFQKLWEIIKNQGFEGITMVKYASIFLKTNENNASVELFKANIDDPLLKNICTDMLKTKDEGEMLLSLLQEFSIHNYYILQDFMGRFAKRDVKLLGQKVKEYNHTPVNQAFVKLFLKKASSDINLNEIKNSKITDLTHKILTELKNETEKSIDKISTDEYSNLINDILESEKEEDQNNEKTSSNYHRPFR